MFILILILTLVINLSLSGFYLINPRFHREDWRGLVSYIKMSDSLSKSAVLFVSGGQTEAFKYYDPQEEIKVGGPELIGSRYDIIWLVRYVQPIFDPKDTARSRLEGLGYLKIGEHDFNGVVVWKYVK